MSELKCPKCKGELKQKDKIIETVDYKDNYEIKRARLHKCIDCNSKAYVSISETLDDSK